MTADQGLDRRQLAVLLASLGVATALPPLAHAQKPVVLGWLPTTLTPHQAKIVEAVAELIIPETDTPGAREAGVPQFIDRALTRYCTPATTLAILKGIDRIEADGRKTNGNGFLYLRPSEQTALLVTYEREAKQSANSSELPQSVRAKADPNAVTIPFFPVLKELVVVGYFTSHLGSTKAVRWDPVPGPYRGCVPMSEIGRSWATS